MSCKHLIWNCYCKEKQEFCNRRLFPHLCDKYEREDEITDMKKIFNKGPATDVTCNCTDIGYVSLLECLFNRMYPDDNIGLFGCNSKQAEDRVVEKMLYLGWNDQMLKTAVDKTTINNPTTYRNNRAKFDNFVNSLNKIPHKNYEEKYPFEFRFILTLILGYLNKLDSVAIINCDNPETYFLGKIKNVKPTELTLALNHTKVYVKESNALVLAEGMSKVEAWFETLPNKFIPTKELTIAEIEKQLGYKIKIVGDNK